MVFSVGDLLVATISVEMLDSSDISSRSSVPVEVAKSRPCYTGVDSLTSPLSLPSGPCISWFSFMAWNGWTSTSSIAFRSSEDFWLLVSTILPETVSPLSVRARVILSTKGSGIALLCFSGMNFLEISPSLGILDLSRLLFNLQLLTTYTLNSIASVLLIWLLIIITQHNKFKKFLLNSDHESLYVITVQRIYNLSTIIDY